MWRCCHKVNKDSEPSRQLRKIRLVSALFALEIARLMSRPFFSHATDVGLHRDNNEDLIVCRADLGLFLVADGMGGHEAGEVASAIAGQVVGDSIAQGASLVAAVQQAHQAIVHSPDQGRGHRGMGSTIVALLSRGKQYEIAWVGDSRAYVWSGPVHQRSLQQLTIDHSYVQMLYQRGVITAAEMARHPEKNIITQCLGSTDLEQVKVDSLVCDWEPGDWVLLCSDGLSDAVSDQVICDILSEHSQPDDAVKQLVQTALNHGGRDNISVVVVSYPANSWWRRVGSWFGR